MTMGPAACGRAPGSWAAGRLAVIGSHRSKTPGCGGRLGEVTGPLKAREGQCRGAQSGFLTPTGRESVRGIYHCDGGLAIPHSSPKELAKPLLFSRGALGP